MKRILVLFAHPRLRRSRIQRALADSVRGVEGVTFHDLYEAYPDFHIDVAHEQKLLTEHDIIVCQHPFYWYSTPAILKQWEDLVLEHGWAYGKDGTALRDKCWMHVMSTGGSAEAYCCSGQNRYTIRQLLAPLEQTAMLCGMTFLPPLVVHSSFRVGDLELHNHARQYRTLLESLRDGRLDPAELAAAECLNLEL
ncbi:Kef-type potassium/proton antiporter accessory protein (CPA2 family) [Roseimicrobium gellanilyticum]|uniref:Kef-type potassium/proton antiporter accessory protein (CPA2 family) n=1 Tax=Roseimicrobium gellanilyticum TaxID=748857 RepID=A0A366HLU6_9BACT|nr:NAD(P)H-dependent oxidoreductase [Roseimicrobium gellanilyticum]RBP43909.1 Kef-type potassium/proton antiporter accessory protein (CPA2 family) [Roseimicrobium gellanilyticum]